MGGSGANGLMWSPMGQKNLAECINGVTLLSGQAQILWLEGHNDLYTVQQIRISWTTVLI